MLYNSQIALITSTPNIIRFSDFLFADDGMTDGPDNESDPENRDDVIDPNAISNTGLKSSLKKEEASIVSTSIV